MVTVSVSVSFQQLINAMEVFFNSADVKKDTTSIMQAERLEAFAKAIRILHET